MAINLRHALQRLFGVAPDDELVKLVSMPPISITVVASSVGAIFLSSTGPMTKKAAIAILSKALEMVSSVESDGPSMSTPAIVGPNAVKPDEHVFDHEPIAGDTAAPPVDKLAEARKRKDDLRRYPPTEPEAPLPSYDPDEPTP